jgi:hypothetical protein
VFLTALGGLLLAEGWQAWGQSMPSVRDFQQVVAFMEQVAPAEAVLYDGRHDGVFTFHLRAGDPDYRRRVVLGNKVLYPADREMSPAEVLEALRTHAGCRWLVIEFGELSRDAPAARSLREAVKGSEFERVRSFPIKRPGVTHVDVYRLLTPIEPPEKVMVPMPAFRNHTPAAVEPIRR